MLIHQKAIACQLQNGTIIMIIRECQQEAHDFQKPCTFKWPQAYKNQVLPARFWTKFGPDAIELQPTHTLTILTGANVKMKHIVITDEDGTDSCHAESGQANWIKMEMAGCVASIS